MLRGKRVIGFSLAAVGLLNFTVFILVAVHIGGDALNGKIENGRCYVAAHGNFREVSEATFRYSRIHCYSLFVTVPLAMLGILVNADLVVKFWNRFGIFETDGKSRRRRLRR